MDFAFGPLFSEPDYPSYFYVSYTAQVEEGVSGAYTRYISVLLIKKCIFESSIDRASSAVCLSSRLHGQKARSNANKYCFAPS